MLLPHRKLFNNEINQLPSDLLEYNTKLEVLYGRAAAVHPGLLRPIRF